MAKFAIVRPMQTWLRLSLSPPVLAAYLLGSTLGWSAALSAAEIVSLDSTSWRLVRITAINNTEFFPAENTGYLLRFRAEGRTVIESDCNAAGATWVQDGAALKFEQLVTTNKLCQAGSLHNRFISSLLSVTTARVEDDVLTLTTSLPGITLEFEPL